MPPVNGVGEPGAGEPHARFEVAGAGKGMTWPRSPGVAQPPGKPAEERPWALPSDIITSPAPDPTEKVLCRTIQVFGSAETNSPHSN